MRALGVESFRGSKESFGGERNATERYGDLQCIRSARDRKSLLANQRVLLARLVNAARARFLDSLARLVGSLLWMILCFAVGLGCGGFGLG